ncbi:MAG TPA: hypothetical protein GX014_01855 [Firmicutes bacterium]|jgi:hypothetical protein|nr:hypothetical protein [Bacillota bacterium]HHT42136.1 hypothetical protein [Bacillota bacterium]
MKRFLKLVLKDLEGSRLPTLFLSGITLVFMAFVRYKVSFGSWHSQMSVLAVALPTAFFPLWLIWRSFQTLRSEWREDTVYTLLALPVPGWQVMLAKLVSLCVEYSVLFAVTVGGTSLFFGGLLDELWSMVSSLSWVVWNGFWVYAAGLAVYSSLIIYIQLAFVVSKMVGKVQGLVALWVWVLASWLADKAAVLLAPLFRWLPTLRLHEFLRLNELDSGIVFEWHPAGQIGLVLATVAFFFLTGYLFEHYVEINE